MKVDLQHLVNSAEDFERPIVNILKTTLAYEADTSLVANKLASDIKFMCEAEDLKVKSRAEGTEQGIPGVLFNIWMLLIDIARCTPPDHPWQECLLETLMKLSQSDGIVPGDIRPWSELPDLDMYMLDRWNVYQDPTPGAEVTPEELQQWRNQNSFAARLTTSLFFDWMQFPVWQLREALEEPFIASRREADTEVWIACEWILRCAAQIFGFIRSDQQEESAALATGSLCGGKVSQRGIVRWMSWRERLEFLISNAENWKLEDATVERLSQAVRKMDSVSSQQKMEGATVG